MFNKYNLSEDGYETFIYYDEVNHKFVQFMYSGSGDEIMSETFHTNVSKDDIEYTQLYENVTKTTIKTNIKSIIQNHVKTL